MLRSVNDRLDFALISIKSRHRLRFLQRGKRHLVYIVAGNDNHPSRSHGSGRGVLILTTRKVHAGDARAEERN